MLIIRFRRIGKKNQPTYRVVVAEHTMPLDGRFVADLGSYNPHSKATTIKKDQAIEWMNKGAKPSNSVAKLFVKEKIKHGSVVVIKRKKAAKKTGEKTPKAEAPVAEVATETAEVAEETTENPVEIAEKAPADAASESVETREAPAEELVADQT